MLVVGLVVVDLSEPELRQEVLKLRRRVRKLTALLILATWPGISRQASKYSPTNGTAE
jgi:hypothetical protein